MIYYEMIVFLLIILTGIPMILGFFFKTSRKRFLCWLLSIPLLVMTISTIKKHSKDVAQERIKYVGFYKIDLAKSVSKQKFLNEYKDLLLQVDNDGTFTLGNNRLFIAETGTWNFVPNEDIGFVKCNFSNKDFSSLVFAGNSYWGFQKDCLNDGSLGDIIYFKKIQTQ